MYFFSFFFFNDTATTEIYTLSLHDALPIYYQICFFERRDYLTADDRVFVRFKRGQLFRGELELLQITFTQGIRISLLARSEEHTSELQSQSNLVCRLLLEKKKKKEGAK